MEYHPNAIIIPDDEEARGLEQGRSQPSRASRPDYSYQGWKDTMDDAAASDDVNDDVTTSPARKRKRNMTDGESIASILKDTRKKLQRTLERKVQQLQEKLCDSHCKNQNLQEELQQEQERHQKTKEELHKASQRRILECIFCVEQPDCWMTLLCGHLFCKKCIEEWIGNLETPNTCPICRKSITGHVECNPYAG